MKLCYKFVWYAEYLMK